MQALRQPPLLGLVSAVGLEDLDAVVAQSDGSVLLVLGRREDQAGTVP